MRALAYLRRAPCGAACRSLGAARALATAAPAGGAFAPRLGQRVCAGWAAGAAGVGAACLAAPRQVAPARGEEPPPPAGPSGGGGSEPPGAGPRGPARGQRAAAVACEDKGSSPGARPVRVALVGSTRGSSSQAVIDAIKAGVLNAEIVVVVSNKASAGILERARGEGLKAVHVPCKKGTPRAEYDAVVTRVMQETRASTSSCSWAT
ncbi:unnamed protein product [Prorocentrum cordatum]|uniref:phosphoribosylglycinamide formyltransferase 1 n=1 Tax=Prorocentrum cordatum TaxID=2364126 RepID=A0ABN9RQ42_9DINO|nr:unnamed protein product [Polarella glacialis]